MVYLGLEMKKMKRRKFLLVLTFVCFITAIIQYAMGNMTYCGVKYGSEVGWFFKNGLTTNSYYLLIPIFSLVGMELFLLEVRNNTLNNLLSIPIRKGDLIKSKMLLLLIISVIYTMLLFLLMFVLELSLNINSLDTGIVFLYIARYLVHGVICFIISAFIVSIMLYLEQSIQVAVVTGFVLSFLGVFISQTEIAYIYFVNAMFYISGVVDSTVFEKLIASSVVLFVAVLALFFYGKSVKREF